MAWEDGENAYVYFGPLLQRYKADRNVFAKALQLLSFFRARPDYPFCQPQLDEAVGEILGRPLSDMSRSLSWVNDSGLLWPSGEDLDDAEWADQEQYKEVVASADDATLNGFRRELTAFATTVRPLIAELYDYDGTALDEPLGLSEVLARRGKNFVAVRMIRNDGKQFELRMTKPDLIFFQDTVKRITDETYGG